MDKKIKIYCATALVLVSYNAKAIYNTQASPVARPWSWQGNAVAWKGWSNGSKWQSMAKPVSPLQPVKAWPWLVKTGIERGWSNGSKWQSMAKPVSSVSLLKPVKAWPGNAVAWRGWNNGSKWQSMAKPVSSLQPVKAWPWLVKTGIERGWSNESKWQSMAKPVSSPPPMQPMETKPAKPVIENALSSENRRSAAKPVPSSQEEKAFSWLGKKGLKAFLSSEDSEESTPRSVSSRAASSASENSNAEDGLHPGFIRVPASFEVWEKATSMRREDVARLTHQEIVEKAHGRFLIATIVLKDQSRTGSPEWNFADHILQSVDQGIREKLPMTLEELNKFPGKNKFSARELKWIEFLIGKDVEGLRYKNCQAFRNDTDDNLEKNHDYVQTIFPSWSPSAYANTDLYISHKAETWKALLSSCPNIRRNLWLNMQLNAIRMIHFWKFRFAFWQDVPGTSCNRTFVVIEDNPQSPLHREGDHNTLRVTRLIGALTMFGSKGDAPLHEFLEGTLPKHYRKSSSLQFWFSAWEKTPSLIKY